MSDQLSIRLMAINSVKIPSIVLRKHPKSKIFKLRKSIERYGMLAPLLVDGQGQIIDGVARYEAAKLAGLDHIHLSIEDIRVLRLGLNRLREEVKWDRETVAAELRHLIDIGFELDLTGFDTVEIESYLEISDAQGDVEDLDTALIARPRVSRSGDIWIMHAGKTEHRIACGDFQNEALRKLLFENEWAAACFTDPPYNVAIRGHVSGTGKHAEFAMASGEMTDPEYETFLVKKLKALDCHLGANGVIYICMDWRHIRHLLNAGQVCNLTLLNLAVWTKSNPGMGSFYRSQHKLIAVFIRQGECHRNNIELGRHGRSRSNGWPYRGVNVFGPERHLLDEHPTIKPSALVGDAIRDVTVPGEIIFDPFLGSGSTLIAAERTRRRCFGMDIEPKYVDLAIRRWQLETGVCAVRKADGVTFAEAEQLATMIVPAQGEVQP